MNMKRHVLVYILLIVLTLAAYWPVLRSEFLTYDDSLYVTSNIYVLQGLRPTSVAWSFSTAPLVRTGNLHPLTWLSLMLDSSIWHGRAFGYHLTNLLLHMTAALLLFWLLTLMTGSVWRSALVSALFAIHPLHVESVAWIAERKDVLSAVLWMGATLSYVFYVRVPSLKRYLLVASLFALGLIAKQVLVTLPLVLLMLDYWPLGRLKHLDKKIPPQLVWRRLVIEKIPLLALAVAASAAAIWAQSLGGAVSNLSDLPLRMRLGNAVVSYVAYLVRTVWPRNLSVVYAYQRIIPAWEVAGALLLLLAVSAAVALRKNRPYLLVGWLWYLVTLVPMIGIVQVGVQGSADRYTYLPLIGVFIAVVWLCADILKRIPWSAKAAASAVLVAVLCASTWQQVCYWRSSVTLFEHALACDERNAAAHGALATALTYKGKYAEAMRHARRCAELAPADALSYGTIGLIYFRQGEFREAIPELRHAVSLGGATGDYMNLAISLARTGAWNNAIKCYQQALRRWPENPGLSFRLGLLLAEHGHYSEAIDHLHVAERLMPMSVAAHVQLGVALAAAGRDKEAEPEFRRALEMVPGELQAGNGYAILLYRRGKARDAEDVLRSVMKVHPTDFVIANSLAWLLVSEKDPSCRDPREGLRWAKVASEASRGRDPFIEDTLAAAYAVNGQFDLAADAEKRSIELAKSTKAPCDLQARQRKLEAYKRGRAGS